MKKASSAVLESNAKVKHCIYRPYAQRTVHLHACILAILCVKTYTKGMDLPKKAAMVDKHCSELCKHVYHPFVPMFDTQNISRGQQRRVLQWVYYWPLKVGSVVSVNRLNCNI